MTANTDSFRPTGDGLGWLPRLACLTALGLLLVAAGNTLSRFNLHGFELLYYPGLALVIAPNALRLLRPEPRRSERIGLIMILGGALYLVKVLHDPLAFTFSDEFIQLRNILDAIASNHLFTRNPLLPTTTYYPGLQGVTASLADVSGLGAFPSGIIILGAARLVLVLSIYVFFELVGRSSRLASFAALLYMANPNFIFFGGQVAYESLALPLAMMVLMVAAARSGLAAFGNPADRSLRRSLTVLAIVAICAITVTHHVTSVALAGFLTVWTIVAWLTRKSREDGPGPADLAIVAIAAVAVWTLTVAIPVLAYLGPVIGRAVSNGISLLTLQSVPRTLFTAGNGGVAPLWERVTSFAAVALVLVGLLIGLIRVYKAHRREALIVTLALAALLYPATLVLRLTPDGAETANRSSEFLFLAIGFIVALGVSEMWLRGLPSIPRMGVLAGAATVMVIGGFLIGWPIWGRFPGPFVISADSRSVDAEGIAAAQWSLAEIGPNKREVADRSQRLIQGTYGLQQAVTGYGNTYIDNNQPAAFSSCPNLAVLNEANTNCVSVDSKALIITPNLGSSEQAVAFDGNVQYVVFDRRIFAGLPASGIYVERGEVNRNGGAVDLTDPDQAPPAKVAGPPGSGPGPAQGAQIAAHQDRLDKWDGGPNVPGMAGVDRIYDSGDIQIYDISVWGVLEVAVLRRNLDLVAVTILAVLGLLAAVLTDVSPLIRGLLSVPLVIALPGYALTAALIPDRAALGRTERTVLGVGMSVAVVILVALGLNQLAAGITNLTVGVAVSAFSLLLTAVAALRRRREPAALPPDPAEADDAQYEASKRFGPELLALAVILTVAAVFVAVLGTVQAPQPGFTQLWMLDGVTANSIQVGIRNDEGSAMQYRLEIETQDQILRTSEIDLASGQETLQTINLPALNGSTPQTVTARLFRLDQPAASPPYRTTLLWRYPGPS